MRIATWVDLTQFERIAAVLRIELARSVAEFERQVRGRRHTIRTGLGVDFAFIAGYWLVYTTTSVFLGRRGFWSADWLGGLTGALATIGALADVSENLHALSLLSAGEEAAEDDDQTSLARQMRRSSLAKWTALFTASGLFSAMFFERGGCNIFLGAAYALAAALGLATTAIDAARLPVPDVWLERMLLTAFLGTGAALLVGVPVAASQL